MDKNKQDQTVAEVEYNGKIINIYDPAAAILIEQLRNKNNKKRTKNNWKRRCFWIKMQIYTILIIYNC